MSPSKKVPPVYKEGKQAGYDPSTRRYYTLEGDPISKREFENSRGKGDAVYGMRLGAVNSAPQSSLLGKLERIVSLAEKGENLTNDPLLKELGGRFNHVMAATRPYARGQSRPIPSEVRAGMRLADFYFRQSGDVKTHAQTPMEVATGGDLEIMCPDAGVKRQLEEIYQTIDMDTVLARNWMSAAQYGIALPYEIWADGQLTQIVDLPPYYVWIGFSMPFGLTLPQTAAPDSPEFNKQANYALLPFNDGDQWTAESMATQIMPMTFNSMGTSQNENLARGWNIPIENRYLQPVRAFSYGYERYPAVPTAGAFQALGTRMVFDEVVRGTIEGYQNQLWVFTLGTEKNMPRGDELLALQEALSGMAGERTGRLLWRYGLKVDLYAPKSLDQMLAAETRQAFTLEAFRQLGGNIRIETGNPLVGQRETAADKVDLAVWLRKLEYPRKQNLKWERYLRAKIVASLNSKAADSANETTKVAWARSLMEVSQVIESELVPMYNIGWLSPRTGLAKAGLSYDQERQNKLDDAADGDLFAAPASFSQTTVKPETVPSRSFSPSGQAELTRRVSGIDLSAAWADDGNRQLVMQAVAQAVQVHLTETPNIDSFIRALTAATTEHLANVTLDAYTATGGQRGLDVEALSFSANYVNAFTDGFRSRLLSDQEQGSDLTAHAFRAMLYATEGYKMAVVNGQRLAMAELGARAWKRVVGADACPACRGDSAIMHGIREPFTLVHVAESLTREELSVQYYSAQGMPGLIMPVPSYTNETSELLKSLGSKKHTTRRARA